MKTLLEVDQVCIRQGKRGMGSCCPIALSVLKAVPDARGVCVMGDTISFFLDGGEYWYQAPEIDSFVEAFDSGATVNPLRLEAEFVWQAPLPDGWDLE